MCPRGDVFYPGYFIDLKLSTTIAE